MSFLVDKQSLGDLNVFGRHGRDSIYTLFCHTYSREGATLLEEMFRYPLSSAEEINNRTATIQFFQRLEIDFPYPGHLFDAVDFYLGNTDVRKKLAPERADILKPLLYSELETIAKKGPKQKELDKTLGNNRKNREQSKSHNTYWMDVIYNYYRTGVNNDDPENFEDIVDRITVKDTRKWLRKYKRKVDEVDIIFYPE